MSNGASSCPQVTLPFGLFAGEDTITPLDPADFPTADQPPLLEQFIEANAPTDATPLDGFDSVFTEAVGLVDAFDALLGGLAGELLSAFTEADLIDPTSAGDTVAGFTATLVPISSGVDDLGKLLASATPPTPTITTCKPGPASSPAPCGTHGDSSITLDDDTANCFAASTLPRVSIGDGACTFVVPVDGSSWPGQTTVKSVALRSGDARLFSATNDVAQGAKSTDCISRVLFKLTPYRTGHYLGKFNVTTERNPNGEIWCVIVDVIA